MNTDNRHPQAQSAADFLCVYLCSSVVSISFLLTPVHAQQYPTGPVRIVVPFPPGGGVDSIGRLTAAKLSEALGRTFVVENRGGANGMIGSEIVAKAPRDGYTLLVHGANFVTTPSLYAKVSYDPVRDGERAGTLALHGWVYHLETGVVEAYDHESGKWSPLTARE